MVIVPQLVVPTLALLGEKEDSSREAFFWHGWGLAGHVRLRMEKARQLRVLSVAEARHTVHTQQYPWGM